MSNEAFDTRSDYLMLLDSGSTSVTVAGGGGTTVYANVTPSYIPVVQVEYDPGNGFRFQSLNRNTLPWSEFNDIYVQTNILNDGRIQFGVNNVGGSSRTVTIYYYVYGAAVDESL